MIQNIIKNDQIIVMICVSLLLLGAVISTVQYQGGDDDEDKEPSSTGAMLDATRAYLGSGKSTLITAEALYANLNDGYAGNDPFILSIRGEADYAKGHIPGAVNIGFRSVFTEENLSKLPNNKQIVVYCYTGHTASQITALLNIDGYDAVCLKWGMVSWTSDTSIASGYYDRATVPNYPVFQGDEPGTMGGSTVLPRDIAQCGDDPVPDPVENVEPGEEDLAPAIQNYLASGKPPAISSTALYTNLNDGDAGNDPFILSIRSAAQYAKGHIPGAINIGFTTLFTEENLSKLPADNTQIVVVCYTGHTASQATALLNVNGYNATALKFAMTSWTTNTTAAPSAYDRAKDTHNYPVSMGEEPGSMNSAVIADTEAVILSATNDFLNAGKNTMITAEALYGNLNDNYAGNDPFILSIRSAEQFEKGHIPGAVNIPFGSVFTEENLSLLPDHKQIVVYCYTGHTASQITALLNVLGYDAVCLKWGMTSWTTNVTVAPSAYDKYVHAMDYPTVSGSEPGSWPLGTRGEDSRGEEDGTRGETGAKREDHAGNEDFVTVGVSPGTRQCGDPGEGGGGGVIVADSDSEILRQGFDISVNSGKPAAISATSLYNNLNDGNVENDPFVLSIRSAAQYAIGHIPGAVNIGFRELFTEENLALLPDDDTQIVVVCYTGHTASQATALLNANGFNATALKWAMTTWTSNTTIAPSAYEKGKDSHNYPVVIGGDPGDMAGSVIVGMTDEEVLSDAAGSYLESGTRFITAAALNDTLGDGNMSNDPVILSIRSAAHYDLGHIPGAINIPWKSLFSIENLSKLEENMSKLRGAETPIVVVCYTGQTASHATALLNVLGYNASTLKHGMCSWTTNTSVSASCFNATVHQADYPVESEGAALGCDDDGPGSGGTYEGSADEWEILRQACERYVNDGTPLYITNMALYNNLNDGYTANDPFILSIRSEADYANGHIPGAELFSAGGLFTMENLSKLPTDRQIVVYCYTGQSAGHVSAMLSINGFDAISLKFGMCSWNGTAAVGKCYDPVHENYRITSGAAPGDWAIAVPA